MFRYDPTPTLFHHLDPRVKLFVQAAIAGVTITVTTLPETFAICLIAGLILYASHVRIIQFMWAMRYLLLILVMAPIVGAFQFGHPWLVPAEAIDPGLAAVRVLALVAIGLVYVRSTSIRESQAAIQWLVPGKPGRFLALGVGLVFHSLPALRRELQLTTTAIAVRGGEQRPILERMQLVASVGIHRSWERHDRVTNALIARCLSWHPTVPELDLAVYDYPALVVGMVFVGWAVW